MGQIRNSPFRALTVTYNGISHRLISKVALFPAFDPKEHPNRPPYDSYETDALWDTGATNSVITAKTAKALQLIPIGEIIMDTAGGKTTTSTYLINILLPNKVMYPGLKVAECQNESTGWGAIIGMDIITSGDFSITNVDKKTILSYRLPTFQTIDYVVESNKIRYSGIGRNDPCPCGEKDSNGKINKFKNCCKDRLKM